MYRDRETDFTLLLFVALIDAAVLCVLVTIINRSWTAGWLTILFAVLAGLAYRVEWQRLARVRFEVPMRGDDEDMIEMLRTLGRDAGTLSELDPEDKPDVIVGGDQHFSPTWEIRLCQDCGATIYLSDTLAVVRRWPDIPIICLRCAVVRNKKEGH